jgi:hypothetical protein
MPAPRRMAASVVVLLVAGMSGATGVGTASAAPSHTAATTSVRPAAAAFCRADKAYRVDLAAIDKASSRRLLYADLLKISKDLLAIRRVERYRVEQAREKKLGDFYGHLVHVGGALTEDQILARLHGQKALIKVTNMHLSAAYAYNCV